MVSAKHLERAMRRVDPLHIHIDNPQQVPATLFAREDVSIELGGVAQLLEFITLQDTVHRIADAERAGRCAPFWGEQGPGELERVVLTPDFHKGGGIPVGTVAKTRGFIVPQAVGGDVCCGMRLLVTDLRRADIEPVMDELEGILRGLFFEGRRQIPMSPVQREAMLREGLSGLLATSAANAGSGLWRYYNRRAQANDLARVHMQGSLPSEGVFAFSDYIRASGAQDGRDTQIGSVGGGNHFVEIQVVDDLLDGGTAHAWGLEPDQVTIMAHSGSVGLGHTVGTHFRDRARAIYPTALKRPEHGFDLLPTHGPHAEEARAYLDAMHNAANFGFANRLFLGLMAIQGLSEALGRCVESRLIYDAPHNLIWEPAPGEPPSYIHRKGACPAPGPEVEQAESPFRYTGHPVIIPGSMGSASYLLAGRGHVGSLCSACHGAGRHLSRGRARNVDEATYHQALAPLRVVTSIDPQAHQLRGRRDILARYHARLMEEAPYAYKPITPVVQTVEEAGIASRVARLWPLMTLKG